MKILKLISGSLFVAAPLVAAVSAQSGPGVQVTDPGVQAASRGTGAALPSVLSNDNPGILAFFLDGQKRFQDVESVSHSPNGNNGLGPRFNSNSCVSCHGQPAVGGTGAAVNPQFQFTSNGVAPGDTTPFFITANGPTREARFPFFFNADGTANLNAPNGGVEDLFTVTSRPDAGTCSLEQPGFDAARAAGNIIFRIPTPTFGAGLIENLDDSTLLWRCRLIQSQRQRWHHHPFRLEGSEQVPAYLCRRGLQRGDGCLQPAVHARPSAARRRPAWKRASGELPEPCGERLPGGQFQSRCDVECSSSR